MSHKHDRVLILDFGSQFTQLIARRIREECVYCEIHSPDKSLEWIEAWNPAAVILSGGPSSVYDKGVPTTDIKLLEAGIPILGICYGFHLIALSPEEVENGPGAGYGVVEAAGGVARHIDLAASSDGASDAVKTHANHVSTAAQNTVERATQMIELAKSIQDATSASDAAGLVSQLAELGGQLTAGAGSGWQEGGLDAAQQHLGFITREEELEN